jgi:hypothetical protein
MEVISGHPITCKAESSSIECKLVEDQLLRLMKEPKLPSDDVKLSSDVQDEARDVQDEVRLKPSAHADANLSWDEVWRRRK